MKHLSFICMLSHCLAAAAERPVEPSDSVPASLVAEVEQAAKQLYGEVDEMDQAFILDAFRRGAEKGIAQAHTGLADCHSWGVGMARDDAPVLNLYEMASAGGDPLGMLRLGEYLMRARGEARDPARGIKLIREASSRGLDQADAVLAFRSLIGDGVPLERDGGLRRLHELAGKDGPAIAAFFLGRFYRGDANKSDANMELAHRFIQIAAAKNHAGAMVALGDMAQARRPGGDMPNPKRAAAEWYRKAIRRNSGEGMYKLALIQQRQPDMRVDGEDWQQMLLEADRVGYGLATHYLGELYYHATGYTYREVDWRKSAQFHQKYLDERYDTSRRHVSLNRLMEIHFEGGAGLERDFGRCMEIAQRNAASWAPAGYYAGRILLHPDTPMGATREHFIRGYACLLKSATLEKSPVTDEMLFIMRSRHGMTREEVGRAEQLVREGFPNRQTPILP